MIATGIIAAYLFRTASGSKGRHQRRLLNRGVFIGIVLAYWAPESIMLRSTMRSIAEISGASSERGMVAWQYMELFLPLSLLHFFYVTFRKKADLKFLQVTDIFTAVLPLAQAIGRWGISQTMRHTVHPIDLP